MAQTIPPRVKFVMCMEWLFRHWLPVFLLIFAIFNLLPIIAPLAMQSGATPVGDAIYELYGLISHQRANRSYFLFGERAMIPTDELPLDYNGDFTHDALLLKDFRGSAGLGWKLAWSDRLVTMYGSFLFSAWVYWLWMRQGQTRRLPLWAAVLLMLPLIVDGTAHYISDFGGIQEGFRYSNQWLATLSNNALPDSFYTGDALGSFNSWMRIISGILFGIGFAAFALPIAERYFERNANTLTQKLAAWRARQHSTPAPEPQT